MKFLYSLLLSLAVLPSTAAIAQSDSAEEAEEVRFYDVEIVIFKNTQVPKSREYVLPISSPSRDEKMLDLASPASVAAAAKLGFEVLPGERLRLAEVVARLVESPRYELLLHTAWRQPGLERGQAIPVWVRGGRVYGNEYTSIDNQIEFLGNMPQAAAGDPGSGQNYEFDEQTLEALELQLLEQKTMNVHRGLYELEGKITVELSRYLHTHADLVLRRPRLSAESLPENAATERYLAAYAADTRILNNHSLKEHRRMRSRNLHYLDHPEFSLLVLITPYEKPAEETQPAAAQPATGG